MASRERIRRVVLAIGGNALIRRGQAPTISVQRDNLRVAGAAIARIARAYSTVLTHGNGPQIGLLAEQLNGEDSPEPTPLDVLVGETEGMIGYLLMQEISRRVPDRDVATLLTRVEVSRDDPAFGRPTKPIGVVYPRDVAEEMARAYGWDVGPDGDGWRRVVPSPAPLRVLEEPSIRAMVEAGTIVVCAGGGGIPVWRDERGHVYGTEAVIDKDLSSELVARTIEADALLLLTDVPNVMADFGTPDARPLGEIAVSELRTMDFAAGSMGPKVDAVCRFVEATGRMAAIGTLAEADRILVGEAGTRVVAG